MVTSTVMLKLTGLRLKFKLACWSTANTTFLLSARPESFRLHLDGVSAGTQTSQKIEPMVVSADAGGDIGAIVGDGHQGVYHHGTGLVGHGAAHL